MDSSSAVSSSGGADQQLFVGGIISSLQPGLTECDQAISNVFQTQQTLAQQIDRLALALNQFAALSIQLPHQSNSHSATATTTAASESNEASTTDSASAPTSSTIPLPLMPSLVPYTNKLGNTKKKLKKISSDIAKIQSRLEDIRSLVRKKEGLNKSLSFTSSTPSVSAATNSSNSNTTTTTTATHATPSESANASTESESTASSTESSSTSSTTTTETTSNNTTSSTNSNTKAELNKLLTWD